MKENSIIKNILLDKYTFHNVAVEEPTYINFFFGKNGVGKSTIAKAIAENNGLEWKSGSSPENTNILVFNRDFITRNFEGLGNVPGVFTVSEENITLQKQIAVKAKERDTASEKETKALEAKKTKEATLSPLEDKFFKYCRDATRELRESFDAALEGKKKNPNFTKAVLIQPAALGCIDN